MARDGHVTTTIDRPVMVLFGGPSAEHDVSIVSGTAVAAALTDAGLQVDLVLIDLRGAWWWLPRDHRRDDRPASVYDDPAALGARGPLTIGDAMGAMAQTDPAPGVFIALHGARCAVLSFLNIAHWCRQCVCSITSQCISELFVVPLCVVALLRM